MNRLLEKHEAKIRRVTTKYKHTHTAFFEGLSKIFTEQLFKVKEAQELNAPERVSSTWVKHLYGLVEHLNDTKTQMIGMSSKDAIKLKKVPLVKERIILQKICCLRMDCIITCYNPEKNTMTTVREQQIEHGLRPLIG